MKAQTPIDFIASMVTPEQRAEAHAWINEHIAKLEANRQRQRRQATAQNELEFTGENHEY
ncbi:hypothetical protein LCGC14_0434060 [marine sediment metagenome]|uniref:Uncharacterized protein n=1 Tax=marine sediment metagenome TaxID=412755 RepID=A0A0F9V935_9ZZZZ